METDDYQILLSSRGSNWNGFPVELIRTGPHNNAIAEFEATHIFHHVTTVRASWMASGRRHRNLWMPGTSSFLRAHYKISEFTTGQFDCIAVSLEKKKILELCHRDISEDNVDFSENVIGMDEQLTGIASVMLAEVKGGNQGSDLFSESISIALLAHVLEHYDRKKSAQRLSGRLSNPQIAKVAQYVAANIGSPLTIAELAGVLHLSPAYFCRAFAKAVGRTPHRFVLTERIKNAQTRLRQSSSSHAEIARALGFANQPHFSSVFKKLIGCSPSEFQREFK